MIRMHNLFCPYNIFQEADNNAVRQNRLVDHLKGESDTLKCEVENRGKEISGLKDKVSNLICPS